MPLMASSFGRSFSAVEWCANPHTPNLQQHTSPHAMSDATFDLLIVDDDDGFRQTAARWMARKGHRVEQAANGNEALNLCGRKHFGVAVLDMNMPGMTGLEVLQRMGESGVDTEVII